MPATWTTIPDSDLDEGDPIYQKTVRNLRDNVLAIIEGAAGAPKIGNGTQAGVSACLSGIDGSAFIDNTVAAAKLDAGIVFETDWKLFPIRTDELKIGSATYSTPFVLGAGGSLGRVLSLTSGVYLLGYDHYMSSAVVGQKYRHRIGVNYDAVTTAQANTTLDTYLWLKAATTNAGSVVVQFTHYFIDASPPYNMGNGDVPLFIIAEQLPDGGIASLYLGENPPWANVLNHPIVQKKDGRQFYRRRVNGKVEELEITPETRNYGMDLKPHPWMDNPYGCRRVILDPVSPLMEDLRLLRREGMDVARLIRDGDIELTGELSGVGKPAALAALGARWR